MNKAICFRQSVQWTFVLTTLLLSPFWTGAHAQEACERAGIEFGFFNGVQTVRDDAQEVVEKFLPEQYGLTTTDGDPITYTLYYNDTGGLADFVETFEQRLQEHEGLLAGRFELFFSALTGGGSWWDRLQGAVPAAADVLSSFVANLDALLVSRIAADLGNPNTFEVSQRHRAQINHALAMDKSLLLLAHSQGNLFVNQAYDHALTQVGAESVRVVHVAPASPRATGAHTLANLDLVINGLRATGFVLPNTDDIAPYGSRPAGLNGDRDILGHGLLEIYLNANIATSTRIRSQVMQALAELRSPNRDPADSYPPFVNTPWVGGNKPHFEQYATENSSHRVEGVNESDSNGGSWFYRFHPGASVGHWAGAWAPNPTPYDIPRGIFNNAEHSFRSQISGPGVSGSHTCTSSTVFTASGADRMVMHARGTCAYNHYLVPNAGSRWTMNDPLELAGTGPVPAGTERRLSSASWGPKSGEYSERFENGQHIREVRFLHGERTHESTTVYLRNWLGWREESRTVTQNINTVREEREPYIYNATITNNQAAIDQWVITHRAWMTNEMQRLDEWIKGRNAFNQRQASCPVQPPPPTGGEECNREDPENNCLMPA